MKERKSCIYHLNLFGRLNQFHPFLEFLNKNKKIPYNTSTKKSSQKCLPENLVNSLLLLQRNICCKCFKYMFKCKPNNYISSSK